MIPNGLAEAMMPIHHYQYHDNDYDHDRDNHHHGHYGHYHHDFNYRDDYHHHHGHYQDHHHDYHDHGHNDHGHYHHDDHHHHGHHHHGHHHHGHHHHDDHHYHGHHHNHGNHPVYPFDHILGHSLVFSLPQSATNFLVSKHGRLPHSYISYNGLDIGVNAEIDDWRDYLAVQHELRVLILLLLFLILAMPIVGSLYGLFCRRCRNCRAGSKRTCYFCGILLAVAALLMFLFLFLAILAASQLTKGLEKNGLCKKRSLHRSPRHLYDPNYKHFLERVEAQTDARDHDESIKDLNEVLKDLHAGKLILEEFQDELPVAKGLAIRFRDALRVIKENLKEFLTSQCNQEECKNFYRDNEIRMLDEGCLHFDRVPPTEDFTKSINEILALMAAQKIATASRNRTVNLLDAVYKELHKDDKNLHEKYKESLVELRSKKKTPPKAIRRFPAVALRRKLGPSWYGNTLGMLLVLMILPIILIIALVVKFYKPNVGNRLLCAFLTAAFILFSIPLVLVLFFLVHGFLTYNIFCAGYHQAPEKRINPIYYRSNYYPRSNYYRPIYNRQDDIPPNYNTPNDNPPNENPSKDNQSNDILESLAKIPGILSSIHSRAAAEDQEPLRNNLFSYNSSEFTQHMCRELVPEPKPGPLPELISRLAILTRSVGSPPFLLNQTIRLQVAHKKLGRPLAEIIQRLLRKLKQLDHLLSGGNESFATYSSRLLEKITQFRSRDFVDFCLDKGTKESLKSLGQVRHRHGHHHDDHYYDDYYYDDHNHDDHYHDYYNHDDYYHDDHYHDDHHYDDQYHDPSNGDSYRDGLALNRYLRNKDLCGSIANPMNAMWFWLLPFALMLLPALCCSHYLRCYCRCCRNVCEAPCAAPCVDPSADPCSASSAASCAASSAASCAASSASSFAAPCPAPCGSSCASPCAAPCASPCVNPCCTLPMEFPDCTHCRYLPVIDETNVDQLHFNMNL